MWTNITIASRNITQMVGDQVLWLLFRDFVDVFLHARPQIWIHVPIHRKPYPDGKRQPSELDCIVEKKTMINLVRIYTLPMNYLLKAGMKVQAFAVSVKVNLFYILGGLQ
jgi:hypothetical protein